MSSDIRDRVLAAVAAARPRPPGTPAGIADETTAFAALGVDSLGLVVVATRLEQHGLHVPGQMLGSVRTPAELISRLIAAHAPTPAPVPAVDPAEPPAGTRAARDVHEPAGAIRLGVIDADCTIGDGTRVWRWAHVATGTTIGADCTIGGSAYLGGAVLGDRVKIGNHACLYGTVCADDVLISPHVVAMEDPTPRASTPDGRRATTFTAHPVRIGPGASIGGGALLTPGTRVGAYALVTAGAVVTGEIAAHALVAGHPARQVGWACVCGTRLTDTLTCPECARTFHLTTGGDLQPHPAHASLHSATGRPPSGDRNHPIEA